MIKSREGDIEYYNELLKRFNRIPTTDYSTGLSKKHKEDREKYSALINKYKIEIKEMYKIVYNTRNYLNKRVKVSII